MRFTPFCGITCADGGEERLRVGRLEMCVGCLNCSVECFFTLVQYQDFVCNLERFVAVGREDDGVAEERKLFEVGAEDA